MARHMEEGMMGMKKSFYLDPDERKWTMEELGLTWDEFPSTQAENHTIEGIYLMKDGEIFNAQELSEICHVCFTSLDYHDDYDAAFCPSCDEWREEICTDTTCEYCLVRPKKPSGKGKPLE